jgi:deazaflavin-dependent oxidoreductase (nitroreductase family)
VWLIKHVVSPLDRLVIEVGKGRVRPPSSLAVPTLLLTTEGRRSGRDRTVPLVYVRSEGGGFVVANARPAGERRNPWVLNLEASRSGRVTVGTTTIDVVARALDGVQADRWWPRLVSVWPAFGEHYAATGERTVFVLEPTTGP